MPIYLLNTYTELSQIYILLYVEKILQATQIVLKGQGKIPSRFVLTEDELWMDDAAIDGNSLQ